jgi:hypothetical protein
MLPFDFGGRLAIHPGEALYIVGYSRTLDGGKKTARNLMSRGAYPLPLTIVAGNPRVIVTDLLRFVGIPDSWNVASVPSISVVNEQTIPKRRPGRPRKSVAIEGGAL